jgi:hypothetical protein
MRKKNLTDWKKKVKSYQAADMDTAGPRMQKIYRFFKLKLPLFAEWINITGL